MLSGAAANSCVLALQMSVCVNPSSGGGEIKKASGVPVLAS